MGDEGGSYGENSACFLWWIVYSNGKISWFFNIFWRVKYAGRPIAPDKFCLTWRVLI